MWHSTFYSTTDREGTADRSIVTLNECKTTLHRWTFISIIGEATEQIYTNWLLKLGRLTELNKLAFYEIVSTTVNHNSKNKFKTFYVLLTVHVDIILVNDQLDAQFFFYMFISIPYMFRATLWSSSGESIVSIQHLVCATLCRVTHTRCCIDTIDSPDDEHEVAWYMYSIEINI
jgi:hypothetical protein